MLWRIRFVWRRFRLRVLRRSLRRPGAALRRGFVGFALLLSAAIAFGARAYPDLTASLWTQVAGRAGALAGIGWEGLADGLLFELDAERGKALFDSVLPVPSFQQLGPEPAESWHTPLRSWVYRATGYDFTSPRSFFEAEMGGFQRAVTRLFDVVLVPDTAPALPETTGGDHSSAPVEERGDQRKEGSAAPPGGGGPAEATRPPSQERLTPSGSGPTGVERPKEAAWGRDPLVLIVHSHTSEAYATHPPDPRADSLFHVWNSTDTGVTRVGAALANKLQREYGIAAIHSTRIHDWPHHWEAYNHARRTVEELLQMYPSIAAVFDIHRQGVENMYYAATVSGVEAVQVDILYTTAQNFSYAAHPHWKSNEAFALRLAEVMEEVHPGLLRRVIRVDDRRYNQDLHPRMLLLEVGNYLDLEERAIAAGELLADAIAAVLAELRLAPSPVGGPSVALPAPPRPSVSSRPPP